MENTISPLNQEQQEHIESFIDLGMDIMAHYGIDQNLTVYQNLDKVYDQWKDSQEEKPTEQEITLGLGGVLGDRLKNKYDSEWQFLTDQYGEEFMLSIKGMQFCPIDFVAKRVYGDGPESGFFTGIVGVFDNPPND